MVDYQYNHRSDIMSESILDSKEFWEGIKKVGPGSEFRYRCIFDPTPVERMEPSPSTNDNESK